MSDPSEPESKRQHVERVPGSRRARLTPVPGTDPDPESGGAASATEKTRPRGRKGPNDDRLIQDIPPHY